MSIKKKTLSTLAIAAAGSTLLLDKKRRFQLVQTINSYRNKWFGRKQGLPIEEAASPDPYETENNKMLDEGSTYGVQYYNKYR